MKTIKLFCILCFAVLISCDHSTNPSEPNSWILQREKQDNITYYSIFFTDENNGWICGYSGTIKSTTDGGNSWQTQQSGVTANLWDISFINNSQGWICGANNTILKTIDGGNSWIDVSPPNLDDKIYVSIVFTDEINGWASNNLGEILQSMDGGISWKVRKIGNIGGSKLSVFDAKSVYALSGKLYKTFNGGEIWNSTEVTIPKNYMISEMFFLDVNNGWIVTENGTGGTIITEFPILITTNGGRTWSSSELVKDGGVRCVQFVSKNIGWIAGIENIYKTTDGGISWKLEFSLEHYNLRAKDMCFVDENNGWIINWDGEIYKYRKISN